MHALDAKIHVGDVGTELVGLVVDQDEAPLDVSGATELVLYLVPPAGSGLPTLEKTAVFDTDGTDGLIKYVTQAGDLSVKGTWRIQGYAAGVGGWSGSTREDTFEVFASRRG